VRSGELSARELAEASLAAIERTAELNAFVALCPERALTEADAVLPGDPRPLCGVPVGIKDLLSATEGLPTTEGSRAFGDWVADHDSPHVRRLREAGAIVVGKTNTPELGLRPVTENARFGATRNPRASHLSAGGSSGGSAAAVAGALVGLADGSDLGGSLRIPGSCCGLVALKPSAGRVPIGTEYGDVGAGLLAHGVLTRTVLDTATALGAIAGTAPPPSFAEAAQREPGRLSVRVTVTPPLGLPLHEEPREAAVRAAEALAGLGHDVRESTQDRDESFPVNWATFITGVSQRLLRVVERLHGRAVDAELLSSPFERPWAISVSTSRSRGVSSSRRSRADVSGVGCCAVRSITVRVTEGERSASPAATVWTAAISSSGLVRLSRKPEAPALRAPKM